MCTHTLLDDFALNTGDTLYGYFYSQITSRNHNAIRSLNDFINIIHSFLILYLGDNLDVASIFI